MYLRKTINATIILFTIFILFGCSDNSETNPVHIESEDTKELKKLKLKIEKQNMFINDIVNELGMVNDLNDSLGIIKEILSNDIDAISDHERAVFTEKIQEYTLALEESRTKVLELEQNSQESSLSKEQEIFFKKTIAELNNKLAKRETEIGDLKDIVKKKDIEIAQKEEKFKVIESKLGTAKNLLTVKGDKIDSLKNHEEILRRDFGDSLDVEKNNTQREKKIGDAKAFYALGQKSLDDLESILDKDYFLQPKKKKKRKEIAREAYDNFKKAEKLGLKEASEKIKLFHNNEKYNRLIGFKPPLENN